ncbi:MAG: hypothetical protein HUU29_07445 [Planctomycetaceae bacterium]|nr:hypothetical protein [Planctomycetaceae bacterium]
MAGMATSLVNNIYPAQFGQISRNITTLQADASQNFAVEKFRSDRSLRQTAVDAEHMALDGDRDGDGHAWGPPMRRKRERLPEPHQLETMAGEGAIFDSRT